MGGKDPRFGVRVVVLGLGHGGLACANRLARILPPEDTIVALDRRNYFLYRPLLRDLVAGAADVMDVAFPLRSVLDRRVEVVVGEANYEGLRDRRVRVRLPDGETRTLEADALVLATGSGPTYHNVPGARENGLPFQGAEDALRLRNRVLDALESAASGGHPPLGIVIAGGGYTGLEVAGALLDLLHRAGDRYRSGPRDDSPRLHVLEGEPRVLPHMPAKAADYAVRTLRGRGVDVRLNTRARSVDASGVTLDDGTRLRAALTAWTAGVEGAHAFAKVGELNRKHRLRVSEYLEVGGAEGVWAIGDCADPEPGDRNGPSHGRASEVPMTAQAAEAEAAYVADAVVRRRLGKTIAPFSFQSRGLIVPLGRGEGVAALGRQHVVLTGRAAGVLWRSFHLANVPGFARRVRYGIAWATGESRERAFLRLPHIAARSTHRRQNPGTRSGGW